MKLFIEKSIRELNTNVFRLVIRGKDGYQKCKFIVRWHYQSASNENDEEMMLWNLLSIDPLVGSKNEFFNKYVYLICQHIKNMSTQKGFATEGWKSIDIKIVEQESLKLIRESSLR